MVQTIGQGTVIIVDIGRNVAEKNDNISKTFFDEIKECATKIIERRIVSFEKNLLGIVLLGSAKTKSNLYKELKIGKNIELSANLQEPSWQMIKTLPVTPTDKRGDWFNAIMVATHHMINDVPEYKILNRQIILLTNFQSHSVLEQSDINLLVDGFKNENLELLVIGPDQSGELNKDMKNIIKIIESVNGVYVTIQDAMNNLQFHKKKSSFNARPWNVDLTIGPNIKIPVSVFIRTEDKTLFKWSKAIKDPVTSGPSTTEGFATQKVHMKDDYQTTVDSSNIIKGYQYGQRTIPFNESYKTLLYESGEKCLSIYGFTKAEYITWQNLTGVGVNYVYGRKDNSKAQDAIKCLVKCLHELNLVGVVRRVYNKGNAPKMFVLMPVIDSMCLSLINICYREDYKVMAFPPTKLKKYSCSPDQVQAFKNLIQAMDLTKAHDETFDEMEAFPVAETFSPIAQYVFDSLIFRAQNPDKPLPPPRDELMALFEVPADVAKKCKEPLEKLSQMFNLIKVEKKSKRKERNADVFKHPSVLTDYKKTDELKILLPPVKKNEIQNIGTVQPVEDFQALEAEGKSLAQLSTEMTEVIEKLFYHSFDDTYSKALKTMKFFRDHCISNDPSLYNVWFEGFKQTLIDRKKFDLISCIRENNLSFIVKEENSTSTYTENTQEDSQLYENDTVPDEASQMTIDSEVNDLFDAL